MRRDDLYQPLRKRRFTDRLWAYKPSALKATTALLCCGFLGTALWALRTPLPFAGEPVVVLAIPAVTALETASITKPIADKLDEDSEELAVDEELVLDTAQSTPSHKKYKIKNIKHDVPPIEEQIAAQQQAGTMISSAAEPLTPAPVKELTEVTAQGGLPRIGSGNRTVAEAYAKPVAMSVENSSQPKIAILLGGMGLNQELTDKASTSLPDDVTFAFAPYGENLQAQVNKVRDDGHEVMLQIPMEPMGYPADNPGPKTLMAQAEENANINALRWHMSRFSGYAGVTNYMGAKLIKTPDALRPIMEELEKRGLVYLEDSTAGDSNSTVIGVETGLPVKRAQSVIDADPSPVAIGAALLALEAKARKTGFAVGTGTGLEVTTETVKLWAKTLRAKGILLVPVSQAYQGKLG